MSARDSGLLLLSYVIVLVAEGWYEVRVGRLNIPRLYWIVVALDSSYYRWICPRYGSYISVTWRPFLLA